MEPRFAPLVTWVGWIFALLVVLLVATHGHDSPPPCVVFVGPVVADHPTPISCR